jgi:hypothetical protein
VTYSLSRRPRSEDYDILKDSGDSIGQVVHSPDGFKIYLLGDFESLLDVYQTADDALEAFEDWAASNTTNTILVIPQSD